MPVYNLRDSGVAAEAAIDTSFALYAQTSIKAPRSLPEPGMLVTNGPFIVVENDPVRARHEYHLGTIISPAIYLFTKEELSEENPKRIAELNKNNGLREDRRPIRKDPLAYKLGYVLGEIAKISRMIDGNPGQLAPRQTSVQDTTWEEPTEYDQKMVTSPIVPRRGLLYNRKGTVNSVMADVKYLMEEFDELVTSLTVATNSIREVPFLHAIGYVFVEPKPDEQGLRLLQRPNRYIRFSRNDYLTVRFAKAADTRNMDSKFSAFLSYLLGYALWNFMNQGEILVDAEDIKTHEKSLDVNYEAISKTLKEHGSYRTCIDGSDKNHVYSIDDYAAYGQMVIAGLSGYGETKAVKEYEATSILKEMVNMFGYKYSQSNSKMWDMSNKSNWQNYFILCEVLALVAAHQKVPTVEMKMIQDENSPDRALLRKLEDINKGNIENAGSLGGMHLMTPNNMFEMPYSKTNPKKIIPMPGIVNLGGIIKEGQTEASTKQDILKRANLYQPAMQYEKPPSFTNINIVKGEMPPGVIKADDDKMAYFTITMSNDTRIKHRKPEAGRNRYTVEWMFDGFMIDHLQAKDPNIKSKDYIRRWMFMMDFLTNGDQRLKLGYELPAMWGLVDPLVVYTYTTRLGDAVGRPDDGETETEGQQELDAAGTLGGSGVKEHKVSSREALSSDRISPELTNVNTTQEAEDEQKSKESGQDVPSDKGKLHDITTDDLQDELAVRKALANKKGELTTPDGKKRDRKKDNL